MNIQVLVQPIADGRFRACAGEPFAMHVEADTAQDATESLTRQLDACLHAGAVVTSITINNGCSKDGHVNFDFATLPDDDWFFQQMGDAIAANRAREGSGE